MFITSVKFIYITSNLLIGNRYTC